MKRVDRIGQAWEQDFGEPHATQVLILEDEPTVSMNGRIMDGWRVLNLKTGTLTWMPDTCFGSKHWRRLA